MSAPRAVGGTRLPYEGLPAGLRTRLEADLGSPVVSAATQPGGMSPGCAARLVCADGTRAFVKGVGADLNPDTPTLFRRELRVLSALGEAAYRPRLLASYDDGDWVALLLSDVEGAHPDLRDPAQADAVRAVVRRQIEELTPAPPDLDLEHAQPWVARWADDWHAALAAPACLPTWVRTHAEALAPRVASLPGRTDGRTLCHWDLRNDNLLLRPDGQVVVVDWGMARIGPAWHDAFVAALEVAELPVFDRWVDHDVTPLGGTADDVTDLLLTVGVSLSWKSTLPAAPGLAGLPAFRRREADRLLAGAARRLGVA